MGEHGNLPALVGLKFALLPAAARFSVTTFYEDGALHRSAIATSSTVTSRNAHTDGDIWIYFADENVLATGGLVNNGRWSEPDWWTGGFIGGMLDSFVSLLTVPDVNTRIVPACRRRDERCRNCARRTSAT